MPAQVDHLVVAAASLEEGSAWCEATFGVTPGPGGTHPLMGTHNRLLKVESALFPAAYLEIIAIDPAAPAPGRARWFGLDDPALQARLAGLAGPHGGPALIHFVARTDNLDMMRWGLVSVGQEPGVPIAAHRDTPAGRLAWQMLVRDDGRLLAGGAVPTLIQWQGSMPGAHPAAQLPDSPVSLASLTLRGVQARVQSLLAVRGAGWTEVEGPALRAEFHTPKGPVVLESPAS